MNRLFWPLLLVSFLFAGEYFSTPYTLWADGDYLLWTPDETLPLSPNEFCQSLKRNNSGIGSPNCREIGEWQRDTISQLYGNWLSKNLAERLAQLNDRINWTPNIWMGVTIENNKYLYRADLLRKCDAKLRFILK